MNHSPLSPITYLIVYVVLLVLLAATVAVAYVDLGRWNQILAMAIALVKVVLIMLFFMHLWHGTRLDWIVAGAAFFWLGIMFVLSLSDFVTRIWASQPAG